MEGFSELTLKVVQGFTRPTLWTFRYRVSGDSDAPVLQTSWWDAGTTEIYVAAPQGVRSREGSDAPGIVDHGMKFPLPKAAGKMKCLNQTFIWGRSLSMARRRTQEKERTAKKPCPELFIRGPHLVFSSGQDKSFCKQAAPPQRGSLSLVSTALGREGLQTKTLKGQKIAASCKKNMPKSRR